jgi:hypothetical protein
MEYQLPKMEHTERNRLTLIIMNRDFITIQQDYRQWCKGSSKILLELTALSCLGLNSFNFDLHVRFHAL